METPIWRRLFVAAVVRFFLNCFYMFMLGPKLPILGREEPQEVRHQVRQVLAGPTNGLTSQLEPFLSEFWQYVDSKFALFRVGGPQQ